MICQSNGRIAIGIPRFMMCPPLKRLTLPSPVAGKPLIFSASFRDRPIKTSSYFFDQSSEPPAPMVTTPKPGIDCEGRKQKGRTNQANQAKRAKPARNQRTRLAPPKDIVKLDERLFYLLHRPSNTCSPVTPLSFHLSPSRFSLRESHFCFPATRPSWRTKWDWGKRCRPSVPSVCC